MARKRAPKPVHAPEPPAEQTGITVPVETVVLLLTCLCYVACSAYLCTAIVRGDAPDEAAHLEYIDRLAADPHLIDFRGEPKGTETHQPPLYYALAALVTLASGHSLLALRLLSTLCGLGSLWLTYRLAQAWLPQRSFWLHWACAAVVGFLPMNLYVCSAVNNDPPVNLLVALGLLCLWRSRWGAGGARRALICGAVAGLAMLTKSTALALVACGLVLYAVEVLCVPRPERSFRRPAAFLVGFLAVWGWWGVRNTLLYGDPLAAAAFSSLAAGAPAHELGAPGAAYWLGMVAPFTWMTFWGAYDHLIHPDDFMPTWWYLLLAPVVAVAVLGIVGRLRRGLGREALPWVPALLAGLLVLLAGFVGFNLGVFQAQARYFFCFLPVLAIALCAGMVWCGRHVAKAGVITLLVLLAYGSLEGVAWRMWFTGP